MENHLMKTGQRNGSILLFVHIVIMIIYVSRFTILSSRLDSSHTTLSCILYLVTLIIPYNPIDESILKRNNEINKSKKKSRLRTIHKRLTNLRILSLPFIPLTKKPTPQLTMPKTRHPNTNLHPHPHRPPIPHPISPPKTPPSRPKPT